MRRNHCLFILIALAALSVALTAAGRDARVLGTVVDDAGEKMEGVTVTVTRIIDDEVIVIGDPVQTNKKGRFSLVLADGTEPHTLRFEKEGYLTLQDRLDPKVGETMTRTWTMSVGTDEPLVTPEVADAYERGREALEQGDSVAARAAFEEVLALDPEFVPGRKALVLALLNLGEWQRAGELATSLLEQEPDDVLMLKGAFDAAHESGEHVAAASYLERLLELDPGPETAVRAHNQGIYYAQAGEIERGRELLRLATEMDPELGTAHLALATLHLDAEEFDQALALADDLLARDPQNPEALSIRYEVFRRTGDAENLQQALEELQSADPESVADAFFQQGVMLYEDNHLEAAISAFERVLSAAPDDPRAHFMLGKVLISHGDYEGAVEHLRRFVELAPEHPDLAEAEELIGHLE